MPRTQWFALFIAVVALGPGSSRASDGALEINQDCVAVGCFAGDAAGFPVSITAPGRYQLTSNLNTPTSGSISGITINTTGSSTAFVNLDLNGFELFGGGVCTGIPVTSCTSGSTGRGISVDSFGQNVKIHNGAVRGFGDGIVFVAVGHGSSIEDVVVTEITSTFAAINPQAAGNGTIFFDRVRAVRNNGNGMSSGVTGRRFIRNSIFSGNRLQGVALSSGLTIEDSNFSDNGGFGVNCSNTCALGRNSFFNNNGGAAMPQFSAAALRDMGGNVCDDGTCP